MKKIICNILFVLLALVYSNVFASEIEYNTEYNIKKAILVENYITNHKTKIEEFIEKYDIEKSSSLNKDLEELNLLISSLKKIQNSKIKKKKADDIIKAVIDRIKYINDNLKSKLTVEKQKYEEKLNKKIKSYSNLGKKLSEKIDSINIKIATNIFKNKTVLSLKESKIKSNLIKLNEQSINLKNFGNIKFKSEKEIKNYFIYILKNIKKEIDLMKTEIK